MSDLVKKTFYITNLFSDIKTTSWSSNELKTVIFLLKQVSENKIYLPDLGDINDLDIDLFHKEIAKIPLDYVVKKEMFSEITNVKKNHIAREINKVRKDLGKRTINTPHPLERDNDSGETIPWFSKITYSNKFGELKFIFNVFAIERLVAFVKYTKISFDQLVKLDSAYSVYMYIFFKIIKDSSYKNINNIEISVDDLKEKLGLQNKYSVFKNFRVKVIDIIVSEINKETDVQLDYDLIKEGRSYTKINFIFDYKQEFLEQKSKAKVKESKIIESKVIDEYDSPFEQILVGWNIRAKKVGELEEDYSLDVIQSAINLTLEKEKAGEIKTTKAAIFLGILENKQLASEEKFERAKKEIEQQQEKKLREKISAEYDKHSSFILSNQDIIQSALTSNTKHLPITDKDATPIFNKLKKIDADKFRAYTVPLLSFYHFETNSNVSSTLSDILDRSQYIEIEEYKDDMAIVQAYKKAIDKIKEDKYITPQQQEILKKEAQEIINLLLGF